MAALREEIIAHLLVSRHRSSPVCSTMIVHPAFTKPTSTSHPHFYLGRRFFGEGGGGSVLIYLVQQVFVDW
jgi:hypothetical protein